MTRRRKILIVATVALAAIGAGVGWAVAGDDDDETDRPITGTALQRASDAALAHVGQGRVTDTEAGDEEGAYEVEVTLDDGTQVDVHLDEAFNVIGTEPDSDETED